MFGGVAGTKVRQQDNMDNPQQANLEISFSSSQFLGVEGQKLGSHGWVKPHKNWHWHWQPIWNQREPHPVLMPDQRSGSATAVLGWPSVAPRCDRALVCVCVCVCVYVCVCVWCM